MFKISSLVCFSLVLFLTSCGKPEGQQEPANSETQVDKGRAQCGVEPDDAPFSIKTVQAEYYDSAANKAAYWGIKGYDTTFSLDEEGYAVPADAHYNGLDFWMDTYYGSSYPFTLGTITLGDTEAERNNMTCTKCLVVATGMSATGYGKQHMAVSGTITINEFSDGQLCAVANNLVLKEFEYKYSARDEFHTKPIAAPFVEGGSEIKIKHLNIVANTKEEVYVRNCDAVTDALDAYACASALQMAVNVQK